MALMALVGAIAVAVLAGGIRVWERADVGAQQPISLIALERLRRDVQNLRTFALVPFDGAYDRWSGAAAEPLVTSGDAPAEMGRLGYYLDERQGRVCRSFVPYRQAKRFRLADRCEAVLEHVRRVRFSYYGSQDEQGPQWSTRWRAAAPPSAMKIEYAMQGEDADAAPTVAVLFRASSAIFATAAASP